MIDTIEDLRIITSVYKTLSLTVSSSEFGILPAAMSKKLSAIESKVGKRLFNRTTREFSPTEDGELYFNFATEILEKIDSFDQGASKQVEPAGVIKLSASTSFAKLFLIPALAQFLTRYPKVKIDLILSDQIIDLVKEGIDIAIRIAPLKDSSLISKRIGSGRKAVCASREYLKTYGIPKSPNELKKHNCIVLGNDNNWMFRKGNREYSVKVSGNLKSNYGEMLLKAVESQLGIAVLSLWHAYLEIKSGNIVTLLDDYELANQPEIYLVYPDKNFLPRKTRALIDFMSTDFKLPFT